MRPAPMLVTAADLAAIAGRKAGPTHLMEALAPAISRYAAPAGLTTGPRMAMFLANAATETGGFRQLEENLSYSAKQLMQVWPKRFATLKAAQPFAGEPIALANKVYGGRLGNREEFDGWRYRGSGLLQTTGRANFAEVEQATGLPVLETPELLRRPDEGTRAALLYWKNRDLNRFADAGDVTGCRRAINGGLNGLAETQRFYAKAMKNFAGQLDARDRPGHDEETGANGYSFLAADDRQADIEEALRADGSRTIAGADEVERGSFLGQAWNFVTGAGVLSAFPYLADFHPVTQALIVVAIIGVAAIAFFQWRQGRAAKAIRAARVDDATSGANRSRLFAVAGILRGDGA